MTGTVEFLGDTFAVTDRIGAMPLMRFAKIAQGGVDSNEMAGLAALYDLLEQCIAPDDWQRFQAHADRKRAQGDELLEVVKQVFSIVSERPTGQPSGSSDGLRTIEPNLPAASSSPVIDASERVIERLNAQGRPDLALLVRRKQQQESLSA